MALTQVKSDGIATGAVTADQIATGAVTANDLEDSGVTAGTYGSSSAIPAITVDAKGRITSASTNSVTQVGGANGVDFNDNVKARFGTGNDLEVFHDGTSYVYNNSGSLDIRNFADDQDIVLQSDDGSGGVTPYIRCDGSEGQVYLYKYGSVKLNTTSSGIDVTGTVTCDGLTSDGTATFAGSNEYQLIVKDNNSTGTAAEEAIAFRDNADTTQGYLGYVDNTSEVFWAMNTRNSALIFGTNNTGRCQVNNAGHFVPNLSNTYDLGLSTNRWRNVYTNDLNLSNEGGSNDVDGTWGSWTIQEGEDDLFLLNRRNGKKYKFNLTEVN